MAQGNKSQILVYQQTREVYLFMINGSKQRKDIIQYFINKWDEDEIFNKNVSIISKHRTIDNYIKKVKDTFFNFENEVTTEKGRTLARLDDLYSKSMKIQDYKGALSILKEVKEILGFKAAEKTINTNINNNSVEMTPEEMNKISDGLDKKF